MQQILHFARLRVNRRALQAKQSEKKTNATTKTTEYNEEVEKFICREKRKETGYPCFFSEFTIVGLSNELQSAAKTPAVSVKNDSERKTQLNRNVAFKSDIIKLRENLKGTSTWYTYSLYFGFWKED